MQEADETCLWLELLREECSVPGTAWMEGESSELLAILTTMITRTEARTAETPRTPRLHVGKFRPRSAGAPPSTDGDTAAGA